MNSTNMNSTKTDTTPNGEELLKNVIDMNKTLKKYEDFIKKYFMLDDTDDTEDILEFIVENGYSGRF